MQPARSIRVELKFCFVFSEVRWFSKGPLRLLFSFLGPKDSFNFLLQGIFLSQESNPDFLHFLHCQTDSLPVYNLGEIVKNLPAVQETRVWSLGWDDHLEKGRATRSIIIAWRIPRAECMAGYSPWDHKKPVRTECLTFTSRSRGRSKGRESFDWRQPKSLPYLGRASWLFATCRP